MSLNIEVTQNFLLQRGFFRIFGILFLDYFQFFQILRFQLKTLIDLSAWMKIWKFGKVVWVSCVGNPYSALDFSLSCKTPTCEVDMVETPRISRTENENENFYRTSESQVWETYYLPPSDLINYQKLSNMETGQSADSKFYRKSSSTVKVNFIDFL